MEENESISAFVSRIKDLKDKLRHKGESIPNIDLVKNTLNGMSEDYQMFITGLAAKEIIPLLRN